MTNEELKYSNLSFDKFKETTTVYTTLMGIRNPKNDMVPGKLKGSVFSISQEVGDQRFYTRLELDIRAVKHPDGESLLFDYYYEGEGWLSLNKMIININGVENIELEGVQTSSDTEVRHGDVNCLEKGYLVISKEILDKICNSEELDIRVNGDSSYFELKNTDKEDENGIVKVKFLCRAFAADYFKEEKWNAWLEEQKTANKGSACFIATAAMGDYEHPAVLELRGFRDSWLLQREWGVNFTKWYYTHGPKAARVIEKSTILRGLTFVVVVKPLQFLSRVINK